MIVATSDGRCCWPGQAWSPERARCEGPPTCPPGRVPSGETCAAAGAPPPAAPVTLAPRRDPALSSSRGAEREMPGAMTAGIVTLSVSYGLSFLAGAIMTPIDDSNEESGSACLGKPALTFIPVIGTFLFAANYPDYATVGGGEAGYCPKGAGPAIGVGTALGVGQLVGVGLITVGAIQLATDDGGGSASGPARVALRPRAPSGDQGAMLEVTW